MTMKLHYLQKNPIRIIKCSPKKCLLFSSNEMSKDKSKMVIMHIQTHMGNIHQLIFFHSQKVEAGKTNKSIIQSVQSPDVHHTSKHGDEHQDYSQWSINLTFHRISIYARQMKCWKNEYCHLYWLPRVHSQVCLILKGTYMVLKTLPELYTSFC